MTSSKAEGQSQAVELTIQVLRQRVLQLLDTVHTAHRRCDELNLQEAASRSQEQALDEQLSLLMQKRDTLNAERIELKAERDKLQEENNRLATDKQQLRAALEHVFPYETYKEKRADLSQHDDSQLIDHFARGGINEGVDLCHAPMRQRLEDCQKENRKLHKESALIQQELSKAQIHMELLKELVGR